MIEHRLHRRVATELDVTLILKDRLFIPGKVHNASRGGLYLSTQVPLPSNTYAQVRFRSLDSDGSGGLTIAGLIVHQVGNSAGLILNITDTDTASRLSDLIDRHRLEPHADSRPAAAVAVG